jgi:hypothetical protein
MNRSMLPAIILGGLLILIMILLMVFGGGEAVQGTDRDRSPEGHWVLYQLLRRYGYKLNPFRNARNAEKDHVYMLSGSEITDSNGLFSRLFYGEGPHRKILIVGYPESYEADLVFKLEHRTDTGRLVYIKRVPVLKGGPEARAFDTVIRRGRGSPGDAPHEAVPLATVGWGTAAFCWSDGTREVIIVTDPKLLDNSSLIEGDTALMLIDMLEPWAGLPILYGQPPKERTYQGFSFFLKALPGIIVFHLLVLLLFTAWNRGVRLGRPDRINMDIRRELAEHCAAVGEFYHRSRRWEVFDRVEREYWLKSLEKLFPREPVRADLKRVQLLRRFVGEEDIETAERGVVSADSYWKIVSARDRMLEQIKTTKGSRHGT